MTDPNPLCCCEYIDMHQERNHILACCCNCRDFDEGFDSFISGRGIPLHNKKGLMSTLHDRLRIPWKGGAKLISAYTTISSILVPSFLILAAVGLTYTIISFVTMFILLAYMKNLLGRKFSLFVYKWLLISFVVLYIIFQFIVIPFLEILTEENLALTVLILISFFCFSWVKNESVFDNEYKTCNVCQTQVSIDSKHSIWLNCCVGLHNAFPFMIGLATSSAALLYGSNLTLTTVCHPKVLFWTILIPDDCSNAYDLFELGLSFVAGLYSLEIGLFTLILLIYEFVRTSKRYKHAQYANNKEMYSTILM